MKASELKRLAESYNKPVGEISSKLLTVLKNVAAEGKFKLSVRDLTAEDRQALLDNGFEVRYNDHYIDQPYTIYWD